YAWGGRLCNPRAQARGVRRLTQGGEESVNVSAIRQRVDDGVARALCTAEDRPIAGAGQRGNRAGRRRGGSDGGRVATIGHGRGGARTISPPVPRGRTAAGAIPASQAVS